MKTTFSKMMTLEEFVTIFIILNFIVSRVVGMDPPSTLPASVTPPSTSATYNLALGQTTTQSSTCMGATADRAVDGNTNGLFENRSVSHTCKGPGEWWQVDFSNPHSLIESVKVYNRMDCCLHRLNGAALEILDSNGATVANRTIGDPAGDIVEISFAEEDIVGASVKVTSNFDNEVLNLAEVEVYGRQPGVAEPTSQPTSSLDSPTTPVPHNNNNDGICSKYSQFGWHSGTLKKEMPGNQAPDGEQWQWEECAKACAQSELCEYWTLRLEGNRACLFMVDQGTFNPSGDFLQGDKDTDCLSPQSRLGMCEGNCASDYDCESGLRCFHRDDLTEVPGCPGASISGMNYCHVQLPGVLQMYGDGKHPAFPLGVCEGDCDSDNNCEAGLKCFLRDGLESVPGCQGSGQNKKDYCYSETPPTAQPTRLPTTFPTAAPTIAPSTPHRIDTDICTVQETATIQSIFIVEIVAIPDSIFDTGDIGLFGNILSEQYNKLGDQECSPGSRTMTDATFVEVVDEDRREVRERKLRSRKIRLRYRVKGNCRRCPQRSFLCDDAVDTDCGHSTHPIRKLSSSAFGLIGDEITTPTGRELQSKEEDLSCCIPVSAYSYVIDLNETVHNRDDLENILSVEDVEELLLSEDQVCSDTSIPIYSNLTIEVTAADTANVVDDAEFLSSVVISEYNWLAMLDQSCGDGSRELTQAKLVDYISEGDSQTEGVNIFQGSQRWFRLIYYIEGVCQGCPDRRALCTDPTLQSCGSSNTGTVKNRGGRDLLPIEECCNEVYTELYTVRLNTRLQHFRDKGRITSIVTVDDTSEAALPQQRQVDGEKHDSSDAVARHPRKLQRLSTCILFPSLILFIMRFV